MKNLLCLCLLGLSFNAFAANTDNSKNGRPEVSAEMKAAFEACKTTGKPGDTAFESCMTSKGFTKPSGMPGGHGDHGMPPSNEQNTDN